MRENLREAKLTVWSLPPPLFCLLGNRDGLVIDFKDFNLFKFNPLSSVYNIDINWPLVYGTQTSQTIKTIIYSYNTRILILEAWASIWSELESQMLPLCTNSVLQIYIRVFFVATAMHFE